MSKMIGLSLGILTVTWVFAGTLADEFPGPPMTEAYVDAQKLADSEFAGGDYKSALRTYRDQLAPIGDKYAQYQIGLMYLQGIGVEQDAARGAAWIQLAAERDIPELKVLDQEIRPQLTAAERSRASRLYTRLNADWGDCAVVRKLLALDEKALEPPTGTRIAGNNAILPVDTFSVSEMAIVDKVSELRRTIEIREDYLRAHCK